MIILKDVYPGQTVDTDPNYPAGKFKNETAEDALDGTPVEEVWQNDMLGGVLAILNAAGLTPSGTPDTPVASQLLEAIINIKYVATQDYTVGVVAIHNDKRWECVQANGPSTVVEAPGANSDYWYSQERVAFDRSFPVGMIYQNGVSGANPNTLPGGGHSSWTAIPGRVIVGAGSYQDSRGENRNFANGAGGGSYSHLLSPPEMPAHNHLMLAPENGSLSNPIGNAGDIVARQASGQNNNNEYQLSKANIATTPTVGKTNNQGGNVPHNNMQPYRVAYQWIRTA